MWRASWAPVACPVTGFNLRDQGRGPGPEGSAVIVHQYVQRLIVTEHIELSGRIELVDCRRGRCRSASTAAVGPLAHHAGVAAPAVGVVADKPKSGVAGRALGTGAGGVGVP